MSSIDALSKNPQFKIQLGRIIHLLGIHNQDWRRDLILPTKHDVHLGVSGHPNSHSLPG